jgi:hypothetical protein
LPVLGRPGCVEPGEIFLRRKVGEFHERIGFTGKFLEMDFGNKVFVARVNLAYDGIVMGNEQYGKGPLGIFFKEQVQEKVTVIIIEAASGLVESKERRLIGRRGLNEQADLFKGHCQEHALFFASAGPVRLGIQREDFFYRLVV